MNVNFVVSQYPSLLENMVAKIYESVSPDAEVDSIVLPETDGAGTQTVGAGHPISVTVTFTGRDKIAHVIRLFTNSGVLLFKYEQQATEDNVTIFDDIRFKIGDGNTGTPMSGDSAYVNALLIGLTINDFRIYRNGYGFMYPNLQYSIDADGDGKSITGTVTLIVPPADNFGDGEEFLISRKPKAVTTFVNDSVVGKQFGGNATIPDIFLDVTTTVNYAPEHLRHLIRLAGANANYVFPVGANIPIGYQFRVTNFGAYASPTDKGKVTFNNAPLIWASTPKTTLDIQFTGTYEFEFDGTNWNCTMFNAPTSSTAPQIIYAETAFLGAMTATDQLFTVMLPASIGSTDYRVVGAMIGASADWNQDNDVMWIIPENTRLTDRFGVAVRRIGAGPQALWFDFLIVK